MTTLDPSWLTPEAAAALARLAGAPSPRLSRWWQSQGKKLKAVVAQLFEDKEFSRIFDLSRDFLIVSWRLRTENEHRAKALDFHEEATETREAVPSREAVQTVLREHFYPALVTAAMVASPKWAHAYGERRMMSFFGALLPLAASVRLVEPGSGRDVYTPIASATRAQLLSGCPSSRPRYTVGTASELWSRKRLTSSTDSPTSRRSLAAAWRRMCTPAGGRPARNGVRRAGRSMLLRPVKGPIWGGWGPIFVLDA